MDINQQYQHIRCDIDHRGVATLTLRRPEKRNAFNDQTVAELTSALNLFSDHPGARVLLLQAEGEHFSAGADLAWMKRMASADRQQNLEDAKLLAKLMRTLDQLPIPTVATVQGSVYGGALGLISCCDMVLADPGAKFCLSEVRLGLLPAVISPYLKRSIGIRQLQRYMLTSEVFGARKAQKMGLVHEICQDQSLTTCVESWIRSLLQNGPNAIAKAKQLLRLLADHPLDDDLVAHTAALIADIRCHPEAQEGITAFFAKRIPEWQVTGEML